jgi:hypothetical protein
VFGHAATFLIVGVLVVGAVLAAAVTAVIVLLARRR